MREYAPYVAGLKRMFSSLRSAEETYVVLIQNGKLFSTESKKDDSDCACLSPGLLASSTK